MRGTLLAAVCVLMISGCNDDLEGNNPAGEPGDLAVVTSQGFPCSEREVMTQHYGFDFEADPTFQANLQCNLFAPCMDCAHDADAEATTVDLWTLETDGTTATCTWRLLESVPNVPKDEASSRGDDLVEACLSPEG